MGKLTHNLEEENVKVKTLINLSELSVNIKNLNSSIPIQGKQHVLSQETLRFKDSDNFTFKGQFKESVGEIYLYLNNGYLYGMIHIENQTFQIEPINKLYGVLLQRDFSEAICPLGQDHSHEDKSKMKEDDDDSEKSINSFSGTPTIDVMVIFSEQAAISNPNMEALAEGSIQSSNDSFSNSNIDVNFNLIHYQQVSYSESGDISTDLSRLVGTNDGYMDDVHWLRDVYGADVVILIVDFDPFLCGKATIIEATSNLAFAAVRDDCSIGNYTFAHEIGHLAGARHDNDQASSPYAFGHG
ncbi:hypothetical protein IQ255_31240 [Pleurocapsales cyanobacterium LEGE 10410]|nr:hypothetical protein [Pleurocapsales cyanobacterium LEGE 10410]